MNKKVLILIIMLGVCIATLVAFLIGFLSSNYPSKIFDIVTAITSILTVCGLTIAVFQLYESRKQNNIAIQQVNTAIKQNNTTIDIKQKETSVALMKDFAEHLSEISFIQRILEADKMFIELINTIDLNKIKTFDKKELLSIFNNEQAKYLTDMNGIFARNAVDISSIYYQCYGYNEPDRISWLRYIGCKWDDNKLKASYTKNSVISSEYFVDKLNMDSLWNKLLITINNSIQKMLNSFEHFCTNFNIGLADESIVYNSIHQVFFAFIKFCYPHICLVNNSIISDYYFSNIVELFTNWIAKYQNECNKENEITNNQVEKKIKTINKIQKDI